MDAESFYTLATKYLSAESTLEETEEIGHYLEDEYYLDLFLKINEAWIKAGKKADQHDYDLNRGLILLREQTLAESSVKTLKLHGTWKKHLAYAAAVATVFLTVFFYLYVQEKPEQLITAYAQPGTIREFQLPDGSSITLNAGSQLSYPVRFKGDIRKVYLKGEALFRVKSDHKHPFIVQANGYATKAVGTVFNIKAFPDENHVAIALLKGRVLISNQGHTLQDLALQAGQILFADIQTGQTSIETLNKELVMSWREHKLSFKACPFSEVINSISRRYGIQIKYDQHRFKNCKVTANFTTETINEVFEALKFALQFNYQLQKDNQSRQYITINGSGC